MKKAMLLCLLAFPAWGGQAELTWTNPTKNTDGTNIPATGAGALTGNRVEWGTCSAPGVFGTFVGQMSWATPRTSYTVMGLGTGTYCFRVFAKNATAESGPSGVGSKTFLEPVPIVPVPPSGLTVPADAMDAYLVVKRSGRFVMSRVGTVPAGTQCDYTQTVNGYYVVPVAAVVWAGGVARSNVDVVVAVCR